VRPSGRRLSAAEPAAFEFGLRSAGAIESGLQPQQSGAREGPPLGRPLTVGSTIVVPPARGALSGKGGAATSSCTPCGWAEKGRAGAARMRGLRPRPGRLWPARCSTALMHCGRPRPEARARRGPQVAARSHQGVRRGAARRPSAALRGPSRGAAPPAACAARIRRAPAASRGRPCAGPVGTVGGAGRGGAGRRPPRAAAAAGGGHSRQAGRGRGRGRSAGGAGALPC
jgi:hypothetical protein